MKTTIQKVMSDFLIRQKSSLSVFVKIGDITSEETIAIVNAANRSLMLGSGVAGAIRKKGGKAIQKECDDIIRKRGTLKDGEVAVTGVGSFENQNLKYIIHAVGPVFKTGIARKEELFNAFYNSFAMADELECESIAVPLISTGIFGYPRKEATNVFCEAVAKFATKKKNLYTINLVIFGEKEYAEVVDFIEMGKFGADEKATLNEELI